MADDTGDEKRPSLLRAIALGERFVLLSIDEHAERAASFDDCVRGYGALSAAERAVAELAAGGLTNTEIARVRQVAKRTITNQLVVVYQKLGVSGRRELRAWFRRRRSGSIEKST